MEEPKPAEPTVTQPTVIKTRRDKKFTWLLIGLGAVIVLLLVFQLGMFVGFHKAEFSFDWGDNYHRAFGGPQGGFIRNFEGRDFTNGAGTTGTIAKIDANSIIIKGSDGKEKTINVLDTTTIESGDSQIKTTDLKVDESVVVIGVAKTDGSVDAKIIRVFDPAAPAPRPGFHLPSFLN